jgi:hypothetical protein
MYLVGKKVASRWAYGRIFRLSLENEYVMVHASNDHKMIAH